MHQLILALERIEHPRVALIGDFMLDRYVYGDTDRISPEAPVPVLRVVGKDSRPGGAGSVAANILSLGGKVACIGVTGQDHSGDELRGILSSSGAETATLLRLPGRATTTKQRIVGLAQHRHRQQMLRVDEECTDPLQPQVAAGLRAAMRSTLSTCKVVAIEDYGKGVLTDHNTPDLIADARAAGVPVVVDPARGLSNYARYRGATVIKPNRYEAEQATGVKIVDDASAARCAERILNMADAQAVVITLDKEGSFLARRGQKGVLIPTRQRQVYDVTGAGDATLAMLAVALAGGCGLADAVGLANVAGGLEVEKFGIVPITREEVLNELVAARKAARGKVLTVAELVAETRRLMLAGKRVVFTNGCFDILHAGHVSYLAFSREQGDVLIVGINSDESVRRLKGPQRPVVSQNDRAAVLAALESVDYVTIFDQDTPAELINAIAQGPLTLVKGEDWKDKGVVGREVVEQRGGRVVLAPLMPGRSTTNIVEKINANRQSPGA